MRICEYKDCDNYINNRPLQTKYCCERHWRKQYSLNKIERYFIEQKKKIEERKGRFIEKEIPTIITPQAGRYQDLLIYSTTIISDFK